MAEIVKNRSYIILLLIIIGGAFFLRVHGINYHSYGDEHYHVYNSLGLASGQLPGNFHRIALFVFYGIYYALGWVIGIFNSPHEFIGTFYSNMHVFYYVGRFFESLLGTASVFFLYVLGRKMFSRTTGLIAALFLAVSPLAVEISQSARGQALCLLLIIASMYFAYPTSDNKIRKHFYLLAGLCFGAAFSIRVYSVIILIPLGYFFFLPETRNNAPAASKLSGALNVLKEVVFSVGPWLLVIGAIFAFSISDPKFYNGIVGYFSRKLALLSVGKSSAVIYIGSEEPNVLWYYLSKGFPQALGSTLYMISAVALFWGMLNYKRRNYLALFLTVVLYVLIMGRGSIGAVRYLFPILPVLLLLVGDMLASASRLTRLSERNQLISCLVVAALLAFPSVQIANNNNRRNRLRSTKDLAQEWIFKNFPPGSRIAVESMGYRGPDLKLTPVIDYWIYNLSEEELKEILAERLKAGQPSFALKYFIENPPHPKFYTDTISAREIVDIEKLKEEGYQYFVICSGTRDMYDTELVREKYPDHYLSRQEFYSWLEGEGSVLKIFEPGNDIPGERLTIYKMQNEY